MTRIAGMFHMRWRSVGEPVVCRSRFRRIPVMTSSPSNARWAVAATFFLHGFVWGNWAPHIPLVKERLGVGPGLFGVALLAIAAGAVIAMPISGFLINRYGSANLTRATGVMLSLALIPPVMAADFATFILVAVFFGAAIGSMDVAMNAHGIAVEKALRQPVMSFFHGGFSIGGMAGAFFGAAMLDLMSERSHVILAGFLTLALMLVAFRFLLPSSVDRGLSGTSFAWPTRATIGLGILCFLALMAEGSVVDWSAILLRARFQLDASTAALGYALYSAGMALSRLVGDWARVKLGAVTLVRASALLAAIGISVAVSIPAPFLAIAAFAFAGIGVGNIAPILFAGGGRLEPDAPGRGIAAVTTLGYLGFLAGPPLIGFAAELTNLSIGLALTAVAALVVAGAAGAVRSADTY
jgi:MFS family permease